MRERAAAEIEAEKTRAIGELRGEVADLALAAAGRVVGESMTDDRQRRCPIAQSQPAVRRKICPSLIAIELSV